VVAPNVADPEVAGASARPGPQPQASPSVLGLASTGADIATMTVAGAASIGAGTLAHRAGTRRRAHAVQDEVQAEEPQEAGTSWEER
jgi:hypothetical protein